MSTEAIADHAAKMTRALRLDDVLLNTGTVPLSVDLTLSMTPQAMAANAEALAATSDPIPLPNDPALAQVQSLTHPVDHDTADGAVTQDAVVNSLQAARDAIHDSLTSDAGIHSGDAVQSVSPAVGNQAVSETPDAANLLAGGTAGDGTLDSAAPSDSVHPSPLANVDPADVVPFMDRAIGASPLDQVVAPVADSTANPVHAVENAVTGAVSNVSLDVLPVVNNVLADAGVQPALSNVVQAVESTIDNLVGPTTIASTLGSVSAPTQANGIASAAMPVVAAVADAVTVPSLHGVGLDALAGLLQPSSSAADASHALANPVHGLEDLSITAPIGAEDIAHTDLGAAHPIHAALPHIGSGLI